MSYPTIKDQVFGRANDYLGVFQDLAYFYSYLPRTFLNHPLLLFSSPSNFRDRWFSTAWAEVGPLMASNPEQTASIAALIHPNTYGTVLEFGPGGGDQMHHFKALLESGQITGVYAAEPNEGLHHKLREAARNAGFGDEQYVILKAGAEPSSLLLGLQDAGVLPANGQLPPGGVFDTIISLKVLCSFPAPMLKDTMTVGQALLKPGGKFVFYEHVGNFRDRLTQIYVWWMMWLWPVAVGGCRLDSKLKDILDGMSGWQEKAYREADGVDPWAVFRYVHGWVQKA